VACPVPLRWQRGRRPGRPPPRRPRPGRPARRRRRRRPAAPMSHTDLRIGLRPWSQWNRGQVPSRGSNVSGTSRIFPPHPTRSGCGRAYAAHHLVQARVLRQALSSALFPSSSVAWRPTAGILWERPCDA
jgi:hypothetical protein